MSVIVIAVATESGVPIFSRKRGNHEGVQFSTIASLHGINMFSKCHNLKIINTEVDNGSIVWKEYCKSVTLIGIATGGLECNLELLLSCTHDAMVFYIGKKELESMKNIDQIKRDLRQCYPTLDYLLQSVDPNAESGSLPTLLLDLIPSILCPQAQQLQQVLDQYSCRVSGRWACLSVHGRLAACGSDVTELHPRELRLLLLSSARDGAPLRETPVYLPWTSPDVAFRAVTCKLLADVYVTVVCGTTPPLSQIDEIVLQCWESHAQLIKEAKLVYPRNFPQSISFEPCVLGVLAVQAAARRSAGLGGARAGRRRADVLATFYVTAAQRLAQPPEENDNNSTAITETYWSTEYHKCHAQRSGDLLCCVLYAASVPTHTTRLITSQILQDLSSNKDVYW